MSEKIALRTLLFYSLSRSQDIHSFSLQSVMPWDLAPGSGLHTGCSELNLNELGGLTASNRCFVNARAWSDGRKSLWRTQ